MTKIKQSYSFGMVQAAVILIKTHLFYMTRVSNEMYVEPGRHQLKKRVSVHNP